MLCAMRKLIARRGNVLCFYSDNGTNLTGAKTKSDKLFEEVQAAFGEKAASELYTDWKFIPAYSPWAGGAWERLIQSVKKIINNVLQDVWEYDEATFTSALIEAELIINNRPLTHVPISAEDCEPLSPNLKMFGSRLAARYPNVSARNNKYSNVTTERANELADEIGRRFVKEYWRELTRGARNSRSKVELKVNDIVLVSEPNLPREAWQLGRITYVHPSRDGIARVIDVVLKGGKIVRRRSVGNCALFESLDVPLKMPCTVESEIRANVKKLEDEVQPPSVTSLNAGENVVKTPKRSQRKERK
jgi:hypothetical protein